jgi:hypothetical protein
MTEEQVIKIVDEAIAAGKSSDSSVQERHKAHFEYLKHITTLSTGSIVLITTFLDKIFQKPLYKGFVVVAIVGFMLSSLTSLIYYTILIASFGKGINKFALWEKTTLAFSIIFTWIGLFTGLLFLAIFTVVNLLA